MHQLFQRPVGLRDVVPQRARRRRVYHDGLRHTPHERQHHEQRVPIEQRGRVIRRRVRRVTDDRREREPTEMAKDPYGQQEKDAELQQSDGQGGLSVQIHRGRLAPRALRLSPARRTRKETKNELRPRDHRLQPRRPPVSGT